jgi:hypothetical protein
LLCNKFHFSFENATGFTVKTSESDFLQPVDEYTQMKILEVNTVAFLPTAGIFQGFEGA